ncbi:hypothetical protein BDB00DRAFT_418680 [Zychaea mexicana]|uniref:uncharacterized protein n=1 Tax=Zychaea mexicana TaxID=64656 RepID=UPI0022FF266E|nr:uncharacterized protein BDB00DRAFT_418680 [Zychaea mexicana]KAI9492827.1 hypothetical protein BDB00DRAFT_418680 [Zychaea mexicana]
MINLSLFNQPPGESWADMMEEEDEDDDKVNNSSPGQGVNDEIGESIGGSTTTETEKTTDASLNELVEDKNFQDVKEESKIITVSNDNKKEQADRKSPEPVQKGKANTSGIVWRLPTKVQKERQEEYMRQLVERRQNSENSDNWRRKDDGPSSWRSSRVYKPPEKNNSQQWHTYSEVLQQEYEEEREEAKREFIRRFGSAPGEEPEESSLSQPSPAVRPTQTSINITADGPSDWADDVPTSDEEGEEDDDVVEERVERPIIEEEKETTEPSPEPVQTVSIHNVSLPDEFESEETQEAAPAIASVASQDETTQKQNPLADLNGEQINRPSAASTSPTQQEPASGGPSLWTAFAEKESTNSPSPSCPTVSTLTLTPEKQTIEPSQDEKTGISPTIAVQEDRTASPTVSMLTLTPEKQTIEPSQDEKTGISPTIVMQEDRTANWIAFAEQSSCKPLSSTQRSNETSERSWSSSTHTSPVQQHEQHQHHAQQQNFEQPRRTQIDQTKSHPTRETLAKSPRVMILNHLFKDNKQKALDLPPSTTDSSPHLAPTVTISPEQPREETSTSVNGAQRWSDFADQQKKTRTPAASSMTKKDDDKDVDSHSSPRSEAFEDDSWRAAATWDTPAARTSVNGDDACSHTSSNNDTKQLVVNDNGWRTNANEDARSHNSRKSDTKASVGSDTGRASAAWIAASAHRDDDDARSHSSRKSNTKQAVDGNNSWRAGATWNPITVNADEESRSHSSRKSDVKSSTESDTGRASAAWIAVAVSKDDDTRSNSSPKVDAKQLVVNDNSWCASADEDARSHSSRRSDIKASVGSDTGRASAAWIAAGASKADGARSHSSQRSNTTKAEEDNSWRADAKTDIIQPVESDIGRAVAAWVTTTVANDDDTQSHSSHQRSDTKQVVDDDDSWRAGLTWNTTTANADEDARSHSSQKSNVKSSIRSDTEQASAAWIAAGVSKGDDTASHSSQRNDTKQTLHGSEQAVMTATEETIAMY